MGRKVGIYGSLEDWDNGEAVHVPNIVVWMLQIETEEIILLP